MCVCVTTLDDRQRNRKKESLDARYLMSYVCVCLCVCVFELRISTDQCRQYRFVYSVPYPRPRRYGVGSLALPLVLLVLNCCTHSRHSNDCAALLRADSILDRRRPLSASSLSLTLSALSRIFSAVSARSVSIFAYRSCHRAFPFPIDKRISWHTSLFLSLSLLSYACESASYALCIALCACNSIMCVL